MDSGVTSVHSKDRNAEVVVLGSVLKVSEVINKLADVLGRGNHESKSMGVGTSTALGEGGICTAGQISYTFCASVSSLVKWEKTVSPSILLGSLSEGYE